MAGISRSRAAHFSAEVATPTVPRLRRSAAILSARAWRTGYGNTLRGDDGVGPRVADRFDDAVVPHDPAVEEAGCDEERRVQAVPFENGNGTEQIVGIAVVECDGGRPGGETAGSKPDNGLVKRQYIEPLFDPPHHLVESGDAGIACKQRIRRSQDPVKDQNAQPGADSRR